MKRFAAFAFGAVLLAVSAQAQVGVGRGTQPEHASISSGKISTESGKTAPDGTRMLSHFSGVILGRTTVSELEQLGDRTSSIDPKTGEPFQCYEVGPNRLNCWYKGDVCVHTYIASPDGMPEEWTGAGFDWRLSYNEWLQLLEDLGCVVSVKDAPQAKPYQERECLSAKIVGTREEDVGAIEFILAFNYGEKGAGVDDKATLHSIMARWVGQKAPIEAGTVVGGPAVSTSVSSARAVAEPRESGSTGPLMLSHFSGVILGKTTDSELAQLGDRTASIDEKSGEPFPCYEVGPNRLGCWYKGGVCDHVYIARSEAMPGEWFKAGFDWRLSYNQWMQLFEDLGFAVEVKHPLSTGSVQVCIMGDRTEPAGKEPQFTNHFEERECLTAEVVGTREEDVGTVEFTFNFNYGEKGAGVDDKATLYCITAKWLGKQGTGPGTATN